MLKCMVVSPAEEELISAFRKLPASAAEEISALVRRLASLPEATNIDWSDEWSEDDLRDYTGASLRELDARDKEH